MKGERIRYQQTGEFHSLTFSCFHRQPYLFPVAADSSTSRSPTARDRGTLNLI